MNVFCLDKNSKEDVCGESERQTALTLVQGRAHRRPASLATFQVTKMLAKQWADWSFVAHLNLKLWLVICPASQKFPECRGVWTQNQYWYPSGTLSFPTKNKLVFKLWIVAACATAWPSASNWFHQGFLEQLVMNIFIDAFCCNVDHPLHVRIGALWQEMRRWRNTKWNLPLVQIVCFASSLF